MSQTAGSKAPPPVTCVARSVIAVAILTSSIALSARGAATLPLDPTVAVIDAFKTHRLVAIGEEHGNEQQHLFLRSLVSDPRFAAVVNDIVVEFGNAQYQDVVDRFVSGDDVPYAALRRTWQDTTQPHTGWDRPIYEALFRTVRAANMSRQSNGNRLRVLLGDPPIDWDSVRTAEDVRPWLAQRDRHPADVIRKEVLNKGHRALVLYGSGHLGRIDFARETLTDILESVAGVKVFLMLTHSVTSLEVLGIDPGSWPFPSATLTAGTSLEHQVDAVLYLGPVSTQTHSRLAPELCSDPAYIEMRLRRLTLVPGFQTSEQFSNECIATLR